MTATRISCITIRQEAGSVSDLYRIIGGKGGEKDCIMVGLGESFTHDSLLCPRISWYIDIRICKMISDDR